jgi:putative ABC transport system permease protein
MIGIFIGISAVVALFALSNGLKVAVMSQFGFLGTDLLTVRAGGFGFSVPGQNVVKPLTEDLTDKIEKLQGVEGAIDRFFRTVKITYNDQSEISLLVSMPKGRDGELLREALNIKVSPGRLLKDDDKRKIILGNDYFVSDKIFGKKVSIGDRVYLNRFSYEVVGIMEKKGNFMLDRGLIINEDQLKQDFGDTGSVDLITIKLYDEKYLSQVKASVEKLLRKERHVKVGEEDFTVESPQAMIETLDSTLFAVNLFVIIIASISILIGGIGITNTMYTSVLERTKEIGIMKSIGARNSDLFMIFFFEAGLLGAIGGLVGAALGLLLSYGFAGLARKVLGSNLIQANISPLVIIVILLGSFIIGLLSGLIPAIRASRKDPVEALSFVK